MSQLEELFDILGNTLGEKPPENAEKQGGRLCQEKRRLQAEFLQAVHEINVLQTQQTQAVVDEDPDFGRFDILIHLAQEKKDAAKYLLMAHVEAHHREEEP